MRYINKEYGFTFRPPFFDKFYEESCEGAPVTGDNFPSRYIQGAGYDYSGINGAMLVGKYGSLWGIKVSYYDGKKWLDNNDFIQNMGASCANTADGSFARFMSGAISVKWVKHNEQSVILQVSARRKLRVRIIFYPCYGWKGEMSIEGSYVKGRSPYVGIIPGNICITDQNAVFKDRYQVVMDNSQNREYFMAQSYSTPSDSANGAFNEAIMEFVLNVKNQPNVYIYASVGDESIFTMDVPRMDKVLKQIETAELRYGVNKTMGTGALAASAEKMLNSILWSRIYYPYLMTEIYSPQRTKLNSYFDIKGIEENCSAILGCYAGADKAAEQLKYTIEDRVMAVLAVWHIYSHSTEKSSILLLYKKLSKMYPAKAELIQSDADKLLVAYKWEDSPIKEKFNNLPMYSLDLSCFKLFAFDILERIGTMYDLPDRVHYEKAKSNMIQLINDTFWNEREGLYMNRYVMGQWAVYYGATSFYPLLAGAVDSSEKLTALVNNLTSSNRFWDKYLVPTLSINNREYGKKGKPDNNGKRKPAYLEYRGSIVPYVNYIIYHGLTRYGLDEIAGELALKSAKLWVNNESDNVENYSMYLPTGNRYKAKEYLSGNGNMLALIGIQELLDLEYFRSDLRTQAIRFGTFVDGNHSLINFKLLNRSYSVEVGEAGSTVLLIDNVKVFSGDGGKFIIRNFIVTKAGCEFMVDAHANVNINLNVPNQSRKNTKYFFIVPVGKSKVRAENGMVNIQPI